MRKSLLFIRSNLKKSKGQTITIAALVFLAALMLNLWLMLALDYKKNFDRWHTKLNDGHVTYVIQNADGVESDVVSAFEGDSRTSAYTITESRIMVSNIPYNDGEDNRTCVFVKKTDALNRAIGRAELTNVAAGEGIYLPSYYDTKAVTVGQPVSMVIGSKTVKYTLLGFFNTAMTGSSNCLVVEMILTDGAYAELVSQNCTLDALFCSVQLNNKADGESYIAHLEDTVGLKHPDLMSMGNYYEQVLASRYVSQGIIAAVISVMAFLVLLIALIVLASNIINYIHEKMKNLGALKALGYTGRQLIAAMVLQFTLVSLAASLLGIALSYALFPVINSMMVAQTALPYKMRFLPLPAFLGILIPCGAVALVVFLSCLKIKKIEPIVALRNGGETGKAKRNIVPLSKTSVPVNTMLGIKTALSDIKQIITVFVTMLVLSLIVVFSSIAIKNIIADSTQFMNMMVGEQADCAVTVSKDDHARFLEDMQKDGRVEKIYLYHSETMRCGDSSITVSITDDFARVNSNVLCSGVYPAADDEIAIGIGFAKKNHIKLGQTVAFTKNGITKDFKVCGFTQLTNDLGKDGLMTLDGYKKFGDPQSYTYYMNVAADVDLDKFVDGIKAEQLYEIYLVVNVRSLLDNGIGMYVSLMRVLVFAIVVISLLIVTFVLYLLVRTLLTNKKRDYGVLKSLGYTTGQLVLQTAISFMPAMIVSTIIGLIVGSLVMNPLLSVFLSGVGIVKCTFIVPVGMVIGFGAGLIAVSFGIACLLSLKVKKITPKELLLGE